MKKGDLKRSLGKIRIAIGVAIIVFFVACSVIPIGISYDNIRDPFFGIGIFLMFVSVLIMGFSIRILITTLEKVLVDEDKDSESKDINESENDKESEMNH